MKRLKSGFLLVIIGILLLLSAAFFTLWQISENAVKKLERRSLTRAYETTASLLLEYRDGGSESLSGEMAFCLGNLPLDDDDRQTALRFTSDISESGHNADARIRAMSYTDILIRYLSDNRYDCYKNLSVDIPSYDTVSAMSDIAAAAKPYDEKIEQLSSLAESLIGGMKNLSVSYGIYCGFNTVRFSSNDAYAEFDRDSGTLLRLIADKSEVTLGSENDIMAFCSNYSLPYPSGYSSSEQFGNINISIDFGGDTAIACIDGETNSLVSFRFLLDC